MKHRFVNFGIGSRIGEYVYLNKALISYPELLEAIIKHEESHTSAYSINDVLLDINNPHLKGLKKDYWEFIMKNPSSWVEFLPLWIYDKKVSINPLILLFYSLIVTIGGLIGWVLL